MIHSTKPKGTELTIDDVVATLVDLQRRSDYQAGSIDTARAAKSSFNKGNRGGSMGAVTIPMMGEIMGDVAEETNGSSNQGSATPAAAKYKNTCNCSPGQHNCGHCGSRTHC